MVDSETEWFFTIVTDAGYEEIWCAGPTKADVHMNALLEKGVGAWMRIKIFESKKWEDFEILPNGKCLRFSCIIR
ncbi:hypothetical protein L1987_86553 [Smallanthus sonchifolius]|uniref:Uncharacterized protein n=1 Tax=Smallanthus sonchifolius TaxID=185202 RepID=A0ACB8XZ24_9ASTR|nr:hypothetical protein L1987_86553 [Smallanthus sonchifolius]